MDPNLAAANNSTAEAAPSNTTSNADRQQKPEEPHMIGDFDGSAGEFWRLFKDEAKSYDDARIYSLKDNMGSALIFVSSYSLRAYYGFGHTDVSWPHRPVYFPVSSQHLHSTENKT